MYLVVLLKQNEKRFKKFECKTVPAEHIQPLPLISNITYELGVAPSRKFVHGFRSHTKAK